MVAHDRLAALDVLDDPADVPLGPVLDANDVLRCEPDKALEGNAVAVALGALDAGRAEEDPPIDGVQGHDRRGGVSPDELGCEFDR